MKRSTSSVLTTAHGSVILSKGLLMREGKDILQCADGCMKAHQVQHLAARERSMEFVECFVAWHTLAAEAPLP